MWDTALPVHSKAVPGKERLGRTSKRYLRFVPVTNSRTVRTLSQIIVLDCPRCSGFVRRLYRCDCDVRKQGLHSGFSLFELF